MKNEFCYDCGESLANLSKEEINKEHIPAKCLLKGYENEFTHDLITIRAKKSCNSSYSHIDDELRNFVAVFTSAQTSKFTDVKFASEETTVGFEIKFGRTSSDGLKTLNPESILNVSRDHVLKISDSGTNSIDQINLQDIQFIKDLDF